MLKREIDEQTVKRWNAINDNVPFATSHSSMTPPIIKYIRPNNYRRMINIKLLNGGSISKILTTPLAKQNPQNHLIDVPNYRNSGISLQVCKEKLIGIYSQVYSQGKKYWFKIERDTDEEINEVIEAKKNEIKDKIDNALKMFLEEFNLGFRFENPIWLRSETAIHGDDYIDRIPRDLIIHDTIFKKVYKDDLEFKSGKGEEPVVHLKNYITNRAIEKISPHIVNELNLMNEHINVFDDDIKKLREVTLLEIENKKLHMEVLHEMKDTLKAIQSSIPSKGLVSDEFPPNNNLFVSTPIPFIPRCISKYDSIEQIDLMKSLNRKDKIKKFIEQFK